MSWFIFIPSNLGVIFKEARNESVLKKARVLHGLIDTFMQERGLKTMVKVMSNLLDRLAEASKKCDKELLAFVEVEKMHAVQICSFVTEGADAANLFALYMDWKSMMPLKDELVTKMNFTKEVLDEYTAKETVVMAAVKLEVVHCSLLAASLRPLTGGENRKKLIANAKKGIVDGMLVNAKISALASQIAQEAE
jgi:hypothetical protein